MGKHDVLRGRFRRCPGKPSPQKLTHGARRVNGLGGDLQQARIPIFGVRGHRDRRCRYFSIIFHALYNF
jgi:hypothetical protein